MLGLSAFWELILGIFQSISSWWSGVESEKTAANQAEQSAEADHAQDGALNVAAHDSVDAQTNALKSVAQQLDAPPPITIIQPGDKK